MKTFATTLIKKKLQRKLAKIFRQTWWHWPDDNVD